MSYLVEFCGRKYKVSGTPMQPVGLLIDQACDQAPGALDPAMCTLLHGKRKLAPGDPIRFANLPRNVTLTLESSQMDAPRLGFTEPLAKAPQGPLQPIAEAPAPAMQPPASAPATTTEADTTGSAEAALPRAEAARSGAAEAPAQGGAATAAEDVAPSVAADHGDATQRTPVQDAGDSQGGATDAPAPKPLDGGASTSQAAHTGAWNGLGKPPPPTEAELIARAQKRKFAVFGERALEAEAQQRSAAEGVAADGEDDSVYELTSTDVHRELAAIQRRNAYNDAGLRTQARRQQEAQQRAAAIGHATVRALLPFGIIVQCEFAPLDTLQELHTFIHHVVLKPGFAQQFSLFVTPPKRVLKGAELQRTFWDLGMVPGAYVHVSIDSDVLSDGVSTEQASQRHVYQQYLRSEVMAKEVDVAPPLSTGERRAPAGGREGAGPRRGGAEFSASKSTKVAASGGKVPKWLKMGK